ncbi:MAG: hypothetical protein UW42_C0056G0004 [Candidatus Collierbacteria bacterium GW2011_GWB1_44_197]|nr:MAG: hypothetical protein UW42_C0056G0004 [Candidatus Collierbacteria bacterium GW2011_GWB1_44_197]
MIPPENSLILSKETTDHTTPDQDQIPMSTEEVSYTPPQSWGEDQTASPREFLMTPSQISLETPPSNVPSTYPPAPNLIEDTSPKPSLLKTLLSGLALVLLGTLFGVLASRFLPMSSGVSTVIPKTPSLSPSTIIDEPITNDQELITPLVPTATPSSLLNLKWNMMTVKSPVTSVDSYKIYYPTTWSIQQYKNTPADGNGSSSLTLSKGLTTISILQTNGNSLTCLYPGDSDQANSLQFKEYVGINKDDLTWRLASFQSPEIIGGYQVCEMSTAGTFITSTKIGEILAGGLTDSQSIDEFNYILEKIVILK